MWEFIFPKNSFLCGYKGIKILCVGVYAEVVRDLWSAIKGIFVCTTEDQEKGRDNLWWLWYWETLLWKSWVIELRGWQDMFNHSKIWFTNRRIDIRSKIIIKGPSPYLSTLKDFHTWIIRCDLSSLNSFSFLLLFKNHESVTKRLKDILPQHNYTRNDICRFMACGEF